MKISQSELGKTNLTSTKNRLSAKVSTSEKMSAKNDNGRKASEKRTESVFKKFRSPCIDAHYEAFIMRSHWTIGNLYAANLNLGQSYVKQVQHIEKQRQVWLSGKNKEEETMQKRLDALKRQAKHCFHSEALTDEVKNSTSPRTRAKTVSACYRVESFAKLDFLERREHLRNNRSTSQPARPRFNTACLSDQDTVKESFELHLNPSGNGKLPNIQSRPVSRSTENAFDSRNRSRLGLKRTISMLPFDVKSHRYFTVESEQEIKANSDLIPKWLPSNLRSKNNHDNSLL